MYTSVSTHWSSLGVYQAEAFITKGKQRLKQFGHKVYLNDKDAFEIELFNPNKKRILSKIKINGSYISAGGIVLNPGERVFLDRFIDEPKLLTFTTYNIDSSDARALEAIADNGAVEVEFYAEKDFNYSNTTNITYTNTTGGNHFYSTNSPYTVTSCNAIGVASGGSTLINTSFSPKETGRVDKGANSNQKMSLIDVTFESYWFAKNKMHILPNSEKMVSKEELNTLYCGECGAKRKKSTHKFCPHCGTKF